MKNLCGVALCAAIAMATGTARANDSTAVLEAGGLRLVRDAPVEMLSETLLISPDLIEVEYLFRAAESLGTSTLVAFPLPEYDLAWLGPSILGGAGESVATRQAFRLWIDGRERMPRLEVRALRNGIDLTDLLLRHGISPGALDYDHVTSTLQSLPDSAREELVAANLVDGYSYGEPHPLWTVRAAYYWHQDFPVGREVSVRHSYIPIAGAFFLSDSQLRDVDTAGFCMSDAEKRGAQRRLQESPNGAVVANEVRYVLSTGANWAGPIGTFRLILDKGAPGNMVSGCFDGLSKIGPTRFEATIRDFTPQQDLRFLFLRSET